MSLSLNSQTINFLLRDETQDGVSHQAIKTAVGPLELELGLVRHHKPLDDRLQKEPENTQCTQRMESHSKKKEKKPKMQPEGRKSQITRLITWGQCLLKGSECLRFPKFLSQSFSFSFFLSFFFFLNLLDILEFMKH